MDCCTPDFPVHHQLPELAQTHAPRVSDAIHPCHSLLSPSPPIFKSISFLALSFLYGPTLTSIHDYWKNHSFDLYGLPSIFPSIRVFSNESALHIRWPKYWSFSFNISPYNEQPGLISFRMDWLDLLAVQGTLKSLLQHHSSKPSILQRSAFFTVQLSHPYMTIGKTIALTIWTFVSKVTSLLFNMLFKFVIAFLPRKNRCVYI